MEKYIDKALSEKVVMVGVTYRTDTPNGGGVSAVVAAYSNYFDPLRYINTWEQKSKIGKAWLFLKSYLKFTLLMMFDKRIKIVHIHAASDASFERKMMIYNMAKRFGKKVILHMHAGEFDRYYQESNKKDKIRKTVLGCDKLIALSSSWKDYYVKFGKDEKDVILLNNIVTPPAKAQKKTDKCPVHCLYLGWLGDKKGVFDLIDVIIAHKEDLKGKFCLKLGGFDNYDKINALIADNGVEDILQLEGWVSGDKKTQCLEWADTFILPSYYEGLPISILEAMSYGMPIISTPVGGIPDVVKDGRNGKLVTPGNKEEIWGALKFFIEHPEKINDMGKESLELVKPYMPKAVLNDLKNIYLELLG